MLTGTIINSLAILAGSLLGLVLQAATHRSSKDVDVGGIGGRLQTIVMEGMSLCVLYIGISGSLKGQNTLIAIISIAIGAVVGELLDLDRRMHTLGDWVQAKTARLIHTQEGAPSVADGCARRSAAIRGSCRPNITPRRRSGCCRCASARPWRACNPAGLASQTSTSCPAGPSTRTSCSLAPTGTATAEPAFHSGYSPIVSTAATICVTVPVFRTSSKDFFTNGCG